MHAQRVTLGRTGLSVSPIGFGAYRVTTRDPEHERALRLALASGCNLIDTSANYVDGDSERLIGRVLRDVGREGVVVVTKAGYLPGGEGHSIEPEFLDEQLTGSLERLQLEQVDVLLLHNPETFLRSGGSHLEYYQRIGRAFEHLEAEVRRGRIKWYGVSSNSLPDPKESPEFTSLERLIELAQEIGGAGHHFGVIQFPFNLFEPGAALLDDQAGKSLLELARAHGIGTLANRPLNAYAGPRGEKLVRLADYPSHHGIDVEALLDSTMREAIQVETQYPGGERFSIGKLAWGHVLHRNWKRLSEIEEWRPFLAYRVRPSLAEAERALAQAPETRDWWNRYLPATEALLAATTAYLESRAAMLSRRVALALDSAAPGLKSSRTLSQKALRALRSFEGLDAALVGMRREEYVRDALGSLEAPALAREAVLDALEKLHQLEIHIQEENDDEERAHGHPSA